MSTDNQKLLKQPKQRKLYLQLLEPYTLRDRMPWKGLCKNFGSWDGPGSRTSLLICLHFSKIVIDIDSFHDVLLTELKKEKRLCNHQKCIII